MIDSQLKGNFTFVKKDDFLINRELRSNRFISKIIKVNTKKPIKFLKNIKNKYFSTETNKENLSFISAISKKLKLRNSLVIKSIKKFNGLKYRQQIIFKRKYLTIINDSKSTSFSSTTGLLKANDNIYWLLGGINKKGDKLNLPKKYFKNIRAFIYGKNNEFFNQKLKDKIQFENFHDLNSGLKKILMLIKNKKFSHQTILFSPCAASFDSFKNFEDRGNYFYKLIKKHLNVI